MSEGLRILFVAMPDSVHSLRWINQVAAEGWDIHLFPSTGHPLHEGFKNITAYCFPSAQQKGSEGRVRVKGFWPWRAGSYLLERAAGRLRPQLVERSYWLAQVIRSIKPDIVHSLEFQHSAYLTLEARARLGAAYFPTWVVSNWGSDIYLFGRLPEHAEKIRGVLAACDYYLCECHRDVKLAREYGYEKEETPVRPNGGGFDLNAMRRLRQPGLTSGRRTIALKGYQNWAGRALTGLRAIEMNADVLRGYEVKVYNADPEVELAARLLSHSTGLSVKIIPRCSHEEILRLHGSARVSIGLSISDGISTSALEAMVMGSFPVQSNTGCFGEWGKDGESTLLVHPEDVGQVAAAVRRAVTDDEFVNRASEINDRIAAERLEASLIRPQVVEMYKKIAARAPSLSAKAPA